MINLLKENWNVITNTFFGKPMVFALGVISILFCIGLTMLTIYIVSKYKFLQYPFAIFIVYLIANFYIDLLIWVIKLNS